MTVCRAFPSTGLDVAEMVSRLIPALNDRKRKVRRAALEALATLAQLGTASIVLDVVAEKSSSERGNGFDDADKLMKVVRTR